MFGLTTMGIPALTETTTRVPASRPIFASPEAPGLKAARAALLVFFLIGAALQSASLRKSQL